MNSEHLYLGKSGENWAEQYLVQNGYQILDKNWRHRHLEIDLVVRKSKFIIFVEVKTRTSLQFEQPHEFLKKMKMKKLLQAANAYIIRNNIYEEVQFDLISLVKGNKHKYEIKHYQDVFKPSF